jgi:ferredoxin
LFGNLSLWGYRYSGNKWKFLNLIRKKGEIKKMAKVTIDHGKCDGAKCGECADVCSMEVLIIDGKKIAIRNVEECSLCEICTDVCPNGAIELGE